MATPTILFNSSTGSDTAASGAGPATALSGTSASYSGSVFTLDGSPDLSGVATDGSHVIWVNTSTGRKFFTINAVDDGADTVTVDDAPAGTSSGLSWGLGGNRLSLVGSNDLTKSGGDAKAGWVLELSDGYTETLSSSFDLYPAGDVDDPIVLRGESGATTKPKLSSSAGNWILILRGNYWTVKDLDIERTSGSGYTLYPFQYKGHLIENVTLTKSGGTVTAGVYASAQSVYRNVYVSDATVGFRILAVDCHLHRIVAEDCTTGVASTASLVPGSINSAIIIGGTTAITWVVGATRAGSIRDVICYDQSGDAIQISGGNINGWHTAHFCDIVIVTCGDVGLSLTGTPTAALADLGIHRVAYYDCTTSNGDVTEGTDSISLTADPFVDSSNGDFNLNNTAGGGAVLRAENFTMQGLADTTRYPFRQHVSDSFGGGSGGLTIQQAARILGANKEVKNV